MYPRTKLPLPGIKPLDRNESWLSVPTEVAGDREVGQKECIPSWCAERTRTGMRREKRGGRRAPPQLPRRHVGLMKIYGSSIDAVKSTPRHYHCPAARYGVYLAPRLFPSLRYPEENAARKLAHRTLNSGLNLTRVYDDGRWGWVHAESGAMDIGATMRIWRDKIRYVQ